MLADFNCQDFLAGEMDDFYVITSMFAKATGKKVFVLTNDILMRGKLKVNGIDSIAVTDFYDESKILASCSTSCINQQHKRILADEKVKKTKTKKQ